MNAWQDTRLSGIYTLSNLHCGSGQASGAVDLPISREAGTGFPVIPATSLKGVAREAFEIEDREGVPIDKNIVKWLFGADLDESDDKTADADKKTQAPAGTLCFTEGRLLAYPARALNAPFVHLTSPLLLQRLQRDVVALIGGEDIKLPQEVPTVDGHEALVTSERLSGNPLVVEDLVVDADYTRLSKPLSAWAEFLATLIPDENAATRFKESLIMVSDHVFEEIIQRIVPVRARTRLTDGKTTDAWINPCTEEEQSGNLWYEEHLPSDCLFACFVGARRQRAFNSGNGGETKNTQDAIPNFLQHNKRLQVIQIGGNETVGNGLCWWHFRGQTS